MRDMSGEAGTPDEFALLLSRSLRDAGRAPTEVSLRAGLAQDTVNRWLRNSEMIPHRRSLSVVLDELRPSTPTRDALVEALEERRDRQGARRDGRARTILGAERIEASSSGEAQELSAWVESQLAMPLAGWMDPGYLAAALFEARRLASVRVEHRTTAFRLALGSPVAIAALVHLAAKDSMRRPGRPVKGLLRDLGSQSNLLTKDVHVICAAVTPGPLEGPIRYIDVRSVDPGLAALIDDRQLVLVEVDGERQVVRVYLGRQWLADYFLHRRTGRWTLRARDDIDQKVWQLKPAGLTDRALKIAARASVDQSYGGNGGILVLADEWKRLSPGLKFEAGRTPATPHLIGDLMRIDGAVWVDRQGNIRGAGIIIEPDAAHAPSRGRRWNLAWSVARQLAGSMAFSISSDRGIWVFAHGTAASVEL